MRILRKLQFSGSSFIILGMLHFVVNPVSRSGRGLKLWSRRIEPVLRRHYIEYDLHLSKQRGDVTSIVSSFCTEDWPVTAVILGGDGTLNDALQGITDFDKITLGYIPTGSSNDFARDMKIPKSADKNLLRILEFPEPMRIDIGEANFGMRTRRFAVSCGLGFDAAVCQKAMHSRMKKALNKVGLGKLIYLSIALNQILNAPKVDARIEFNDGRILELPKFLFAAAMVHRFEGGGFKFCPKADCTDGIMDLCLAHGLSPFKVLTAIPTAFWGGHTKFQGIENHTFKSATLTSNIPLWFHTDGEVGFKASKITITTLEKRLKIII